MKNLHLVLVLFSIASMFTSFGVYDVDATKSDNNGYAYGCEKGNEKVKEKNPKCNATSSSCDTTIDMDCDGIPDATDICFDIAVGPLGQLPDDWDGDGVLNDDDGFICDPIK